MIVTLEKPSGHPVHRLFLTYESYRLGLVLQWPRALFWQGVVYPSGLSENLPSECQFLVFRPENEDELLGCLLEEFRLQRGGGEAEWAWLGLTALGVGVSRERVDGFMASVVSLPVQSAALWAWALENEVAVSLGVRYGVSLRLLYGWREDAAWLEWLASALPLLQANGNQLRQIYQGFQALRNGKGWDVAEILTHLGWEAIAKMEETPVKRLEILTVRLRQLRYPQFSLLEGNLVVLRQRILKKTGWKLDWPPFLEGETLTLSLPVKKHGDIAAISPLVQSIVDEMETAIRILRGEQQ